AKVPYFSPKKTMSPDETHQTSKSAKDNNINSHQGSGGRKTSSSTSSSTKPQEQNMKCPRCDSPNTKFCYYNNYSLTQPRHFCKTCRRYWTKGGALRNVPIGDVPCENSLLRQVSSLLRRLPAIESGKFQDDFLMEYNDTLLISYLAMLTNCSSAMNDLVDKFDTAYDRHTRRGGRTAFM
ncbi:hypothetical protein RYX36_035785, partial [Vicia faba]